MRKRRHIPAWILALSLALSLLTVPVFAVQGGYLTHAEAIRFVDMQIHTDLENSGFLPDANTSEYYDPANDRTYTYEGYNVFTRGTAVTVTNLADNPQADAWIEVYLFPYRQQEDGSFVSLLEPDTYGTIYGDAAYGYAPYVLTAGGAFMPWAEVRTPAAQAGEPGQREVVRALYPGDSVTFTLPFDQLGEDTLYDLRAQIWYRGARAEETGAAVYDASWCSYRVKLDEHLAAQLRAEQTGTAPTAYAGTQTVSIDGEPVELQTYALKDAAGNPTNYVKLRDIASLLNGTAAQFQVCWDGSVNLLPGQSYTPNGSELSTPFTGDQTYTIPTAVTSIDGDPAELAAISLTDDNGGSYTYYQLRDLGRALGFHVGWSADRGIFIETDRPYTGAD